MLLVNSSIMNTHRRQLAREAKAIVALAFRNGPIENIHAGRPCPTCTGQTGYSRITEDEMRLVMKSAVDRLYALLSLKDEDPESSTNLESSLGNATRRHGMSPGCRRGSKAERIRRIKALSREL
jgi:hypothetical protein